MPHSARQRRWKHEQSYCEIALGRIFRPSHARQVAGLEESGRERRAAAIYDYEQAPAKCLYTTKDAADQLYGEYGEETEVEE